jgi:hypothetical protein
VQDGAQFFMTGAVALGGDSEAVDLSIFDKDIHSGVPRTNPYAVLLDNYILQGGDPYGRDTGDGYEVTQAPGPFQFAQTGGAPQDESITASGTTFTATEGASFAGTVATFADPDTAATAAEYAATIDWGDGSATTSGVITGGAGSFNVSGTHTYTEEGGYRVTVTISDVDNAANTRRRARRPPSGTWRSRRAVRRRPLPRRRSKATWPRSPTRTRTRRRPTSPPRSTGATARPRPER